MLRVSALLLLAVAHSWAVTFPLGGLFPTTGPNVESGQQRLSAAKLAVAAVNADNVNFPNITLDFQTRDTQSVGWEGVAAAVDLISAGVIGIVGSSSSSICIAVQNYMEALAPPKPQVSYSCTSADLTSVEHYGNFLRVVSPDNFQGDALASVVEHFDWRNVATISGDDNFGISGIEAFEIALPSTTSIVIRRTFAVGGTDTTVVDRALSDIRAEGVRIIVLNAVLADVRFVLQRAEAAGMFNGVYVFLSTNAEGVDDGNFNDLSGLIGILPSRGESLPGYSEFAATWLAADPGVYIGAGVASFGTFTPFAYDAVFAYAYALKALMASGGDPFDGAQLVAALSAASFTGATGVVSFDSNGDRVGQYRLVNFQSGSLVTVGQVNQPAGVWTYSVAAEPIWMDGTTTVPTSELFTICQPGFFQFVSNTSSPSCQQCKRGFFQPQADTQVTQCEPCEPGFFADLLGTSNCLPCKPGTIAPLNGSLACTNCDEFSFQPLPNQTQCVHCPKFATRVAGRPATVATACSCNPGYYGADGGECKECDITAGQYCPGGTPYPLAADGWWRIQSTDLAFFRCRPAENCLGGPTTLEEKCIEGATGRMCADCSDGYYIDNGVCTKCSGTPSLSTVRLFFMMLAAIVGGLLMFFLTGADLAGLEGKKLNDSQIRFLVMMFHALDEWDNDYVMPSELSLMVDILEVDFDNSDQMQHKKDMLHGLAHGDADGKIAEEEFIQLCREVLRGGDVPDDTCDADELVAAYRREHAEDLNEEEKEERKNMNAAGKLGNLKGSRNKSSNGSSGLMAASIALSNIQILAQFDQFDMTFPDSVRSMLNIASVFNFNVQLTQPECSTGFSFFTKYRFTVFCPLLVFVFCFIVFAFKCVRMHLSGETNEVVKKTAFRRYGTTAVVVYIQLLLVLYIFFAKGILEIFACTSQPDGTYSLDAYPAQYCLTRPWRLHMYLGILGTFVWIIGIPLFFFLFLVGVRAHEENEFGTGDYPTVGEIAHSLKKMLCTRTSGEDEAAIRNELVHNPFAFSFIKKYEHHMFFWEVLVVLRKLAIVVISLFFSTRAQLQKSFALGVQFGAIILLTNARPYEENIHDFLDMSLLITTFIVLFGGIVFSDRATQGDQITANIVEAIMMMAIVFGIIVIIGVLAIELRAKVQEYTTEEKKEDKETTARLRAKSNASALKRGNKKEVEMAPVGSTNAPAPADAPAPAPATAAV